MEEEIAKNLSFMISVEMTLLIFSSNLQWIDRQEWGYYLTEEEFHLTGETNLVRFSQDKMIFGNDKELYSFNLSDIFRSLH